MEHCHSKTTDRCTIGLIRLTGKCNDVLLSGVRQIPGGPIYKISYDTLTIILRRCQSHDRLTTSVEFTNLSYDYHQINLSTS